MGKVLFFDIDGTLIDYDGNMPASTRYALEQARLHGHQIVICSGRARYQMAEELLSMADGMIGTTGANVVFHGKTIYQHFIPADTRKKIFQVLERSSAQIAGMSEKTMYMNAGAYQYLYNKFASMGGDEGRVQEIMGDTVITDTASEVEELKKVLYYDSAWNVAQVAEALKDCCDVTASSFEKPVEDCGEITCKGINKAFGMEKYLEYQGLSKEDTIAFGDGPNDFDMIAYANIGVVMGNGREELKKLADYVTKNVDRDGICFAMEQLGLI
ncbi:MAG: HAD family hydrolase [Lachnospiraceae bacterium]